MGFPHLLPSPLSCCSTVPQVEMPMSHHCALRQVERPRQTETKIKFKIKKIRNSSTFGSQESKNDHAVNSSWRHLKLTNPLESAIPLGILQSNACSGQNKGITVTKARNSTEVVFQEEKCGNLSELNTLGTFGEALHRMDETPFLSYPRERIPTAHRSSCQKKHPHILSRAISFQF